MSEKPSYEELEIKVQDLEKYLIKFQSLETELQDEINWRRMLITESRDGIVVLNRDGKVIEANKQFADILAYSINEVLELHAWDWDTEHTKEQILEMAKSVDENGHHFETRHRRKDGILVDIELSNNGAIYRGQKLIFCICRDITERKKASKKQAETVASLEAALTQVDNLKGILPLCSFCKNIRGENGIWQDVDVYLSNNSGADISHGVCPDCSKKHYAVFDPII